MYTITTTDGMKWRFSVRNQTCGPLVSASPYVGDSVSIDVILFSVNVGLQLCAQDTTPNVPAGYLILDGATFGIPQDQLHQAQSIVDALDQLHKEAA